MTTHIDNKYFKTFNENLPSFIRYSEEGTIVKTMDFDVSNALWMVTAHCTCERCGQYFKSINSIYEIIRDDDRSTYICNECIVVEEYANTKTIKDSIIEDIHCT